MIDRIVAESETNQKPAHNVKDAPQCPEGVRVAGQVLQLTVANGEGRVDRAFFNSQTTMQAYLTEHYPKASQNQSDTRYYALDSLDPFVPPNKYVSTSKNVWTTTPPVEGEPSQIDGVVTAFIDNNPPGAQPHQVTLKEQIAIGVWKDTSEAIEFYSRTKSDMIIRDSGILGNAATRTNPVKPNEVYLQPRPILPVS